jgi:hypothetical protein
VVAKEATDATVFDTLHRLFGVGDFDGDDSTWPKWRMGQIARIKAYRLKHKVDPFELVEAAHYCRRRNVWIKAHWELYEHLPALNRERLQKAELARRADFEDAMADAIAIEADKPDSLWLGRLVRASGPARQEVYDAWVTWCGSTRGA